MVGGLFEFVLLTLTRKPAAVMPWPDFDILAGMDLRDNLQKLLVE